MGNQQTVSEMLNAIIHGVTDNSNQTKLHPSQPLNVIAGDGLDDPSPNDIMVEDGRRNYTNELGHFNSQGTKDNLMIRDFEFKETTNTLEDQSCKGGDEWSSYNEVCKLCQIEKIVGTCNHCGIHLYGSGTYLGLPNQFDIKVRRRQ